MEFPPDSRVPIAQLQPSLDPSVSFVEGLVTLIWPYSSSNRSTSILLVEPDFRLRRNHGQVRISFTGASAKAIAKSGLTSGDRVSVRLTAALWLPENAGGAPPQRGPGWELQYGRSLTIQISQEAREPFLVNVDSPSPTLAPQDVVRTPPRSPLSKLLLPLHITDVSQDAAKTWSSPAFLKRKGLAETSFFDSVYDSLTNDGEARDDRPRKKARFGRRSDQWTFLERTPSPEVESQDETVQASNTLAQKHGEKEQEILNAENAPDVWSSALLNTIDNIIFTQDLPSQEIQTQVATPASFAPNDHSDAGQATDKPPPASPGISDVDSSLEREREEVVHPSKKSEHGNAHVLESASSESGNNEALEQLLEADGPKREHLLQSDAYEDEKAESNDKHVILYESVAQEQHLSLETSDPRASDLKSAEPLERVEDLHDQFSHNAPPIPVSDLEHVELDGAVLSRIRHSDSETNDDKVHAETLVEPAQGHIIVSSIANTSRTDEHPDLQISDEILIHETDIYSASMRSNVSSQNELHSDSAMQGTQRYASASEDGSDPLDNGDEEDGMSAIEEQQVDLFGQEAEESENSNDLMTDVVCGAPDGIGAIPTEKTRATIEIIDIDSQDDEEEVLSDEDEESGVSDYERINVLEHPAESPNDGSEESEESYQSGEDSILSFAQAARSYMEHDHRDEDSEEGSESDEDAELADLENDSQINILEYPAGLPYESSEVSQVSQPSGSDDVMFVNAADTVVEHDHRVEDNREESNDDEAAKVENLENDSQISILEDPAELPGEGSDGLQQSAEADAILVAEPAISVVEQDHGDKVEVDDANPDEQPENADIEDESQMDIPEYPAEVSNKQIEESFPPDRDEPITFVNVATSSVEAGWRDEIDEELESDKDEKSADLERVGQVSTPKDYPGFLSAIPERPSVSDENATLSMADHDRRDKPYSQSYPALARDAVLQAELQEGITMDEALYVPRERPSSPLEDDSIDQDLGKDREVVHGSGRHGNRFSFPFTPQLSGLSALHPDPDILVDQWSMHHQPAEGVTANPTSSFTLPDYDSVLDGFDSQPGEQLITPLPTQIPEPEDDDLKSQVELDLEDESRNGNGDDLVKDDTKLLPLPVAPAASRPLIGILKSLKASPGVRAAKSGDGDFSERTELWSDVSASGERLLKGEKNLPCESGSMASLVNDDGHADAMSLELSSSHDILDLNNAEEELFKHSADKTSLQTSQRGFRTPLSYFVPLSSLAEYFSSTIDVFAVAISSTKASRATKGPRDYYQTVFIADSSSSPTNAIPDCTTAQIFRPYKQALPTFKSGDALLLRNFKVQMQKHNPMLLSTEYSAWAVFREGTDVQIHGPHVEFGDEEKGFAKGLTEWWHSLGTEIQNQFVNNVPQVESSSKGKPKGKKQEKRISEVVHELRDGTKYTDSSADMNSIHELRDGTMYADDKVL
ncbi:hypothetical protein MMC18_003051 [Xylographa bjoerkii]|nr:hypothetical protein [Xylographa bjoerkii]